ncbi:MAG: hypothetical protein ACM3PY_09360, partial [Omnitrophica WOR_2 bacterium]
KGARLDWEDPRHMSNTSSGCIGGLVSIAYLLIDLAFFFVPAILMPVIGLPEITGQLIGLVIGGLVSLACAVLPPMLVVNQVARIGEG